MKRLALLALVLAAAPAEALSEKLVFHGNPDATGHYGFQVDDNPTHFTCPSPYSSESCIDFQRSAFGNDYLATSLPNEKHAYRVRFWLYAAPDQTQSKFRAMFSLTPGGATPAGEGDGDHTGAWGESVQAIFAENSVGYDIRLAEATGERLETLAIGAENRDSSAWRAYDFIVNTDTQDARLINDQGDAILQAKLLHHQDKAIESQWYRGTGGDWYYAANLYLRTGGDSTAVYDQDPRPPIISNLTQNPAFVSPAQTVKVSATIRDDWGSATAVLHSWVKDPAKDTFTPAADLGMQNVGAHYEATLPAHAAGAVVRYQVEATATSGLKATSTTIEYQVGSTDPPKDVGSGGAIGAFAANTLMVGATGFAVAVLVGVAGALLEETADKQRAAKWAMTWLVLGVVWLALCFAFDGLGKFFSGPWGVPLAVLALVLGVVVVVARRQNGVRA